MNKHFKCAIVGGIFLISGIACAFCYMKKRKAKNMGKKIDLNVDTALFIMD